MLRHILYDANIEIINQNETKKPAIIVTPTSSLYRINPIERLTINEGTEIDEIRLPFHANKQRFYYYDLLLSLHSSNRSTQVERSIHLGGTAGSPGWNARLTWVERLNDYNKKRKTSLTKSMFMLIFLIIIGFLQDTNHLPSCQKQTEKMNRIKLVVIVNHIEAGSPICFSAESLIWSLLHTA
jgi:hypothetical protein